MIKKEQIQEVMEEAVESFWNKVVEKFPNVETTDCTPYFVGELDQACINSITDWLKNCGEKIEN